MTGRSVRSRPGDTTVTGDVHTELMLEGATIERAYFQRAAELAGGPGAILIGQFLASWVGERCCLVQITRTEGRFTLVLDPEWAELGLDLRGISKGSADLDMDLPRSSLRAVIHGWPEGWAELEDPDLELHLSDDEVPHVTLTDGTRSDQPES